MKQVWFIRAGEGGYLVKEFLKGFVAIGWVDIGDLSSVHDQDTLRSIYMKYYPGQQPSKVGNAVAMLHKFRTRIQEGDMVITYDGQKRVYHVGRITGEYQYQPNKIPEYPHMRKVKWENKINRDALLYSTRNSLGSTLTIFSITDELWADIQSVIEGTKAPGTEKSVEDKVELEQIREETSSKAHELIKDKILNLDDEELVNLTAVILRAMGYHARVTPEGPDRGVDIIASPDGLGLEQPRIKVEVKHRQSTRIRAVSLRSFIGGLREGDRGLYVSSGGFTKDAKYEADRSNIPVTLLDLDELAKLVVTHYENFDFEGRALIPLIRVYWLAE